jgi:two-component system NtrC family response regulator
MDLDPSSDHFPADKTSGPAILLIDDAEADRLLFKTNCADAIEAQGYRLILCGGIAEAIQILLTTDVHVIVLDKDLGESVDDARHNGILCIPELLAIRPYAQILMLTGSDKRQDVVEAMRKGAFGYVVKGEKKELLLEQLKSAARYAGLVLKSIRAEVQRTDQGEKTPELPGSSPAIQGLRRQVEVLARSDASVLLLGESGTGKSVTALIGHKLRQKYLKQNGPFVQQNMAALPENLIERELFGHEKGAFTGATEGKMGLVEAADGGTLFLDEIGDAPLDLQAKLLLVLERGEYRRVGSSQVRKSQFRLICATNKNLHQMIRDGKFREDLYYRISVITIQVPSLMDRKDDIPEIVKTLLPRCCEKAGVYVQFEDIPEGFIRNLADNPPSGNLRGIENELIRLLLMSDRDKNNIPILSHWKKAGKAQKTQTWSIPNRDEALTLNEIMTRPFDVVGRDGFQGYSKFIDSVTQRLIMDARKKYAKNSEIAKALDVSEGFVSMKLKELGLSQRQLKKANVLPEELKK